MRKADLSLRAGRRPRPWPDATTADAIQQEVAREIEQLLRTIFTGGRKTGHMDLEAVEMLVRSAMHQAGATALTELLRFPVPDHRAISCPCGDQARYRELRAKTVLTAAGKVEVSRPWYLCPKDSSPRMRNSLWSTPSPHPAYGACKRW